MPVNHKWDEAGSFASRADGLKHEPEWSFQISARYFFSHTSSDAAVSRLFLSERRSEGDFVHQRGKPADASGTQLFHTSVDYHGGVNTTMLPDARGDVSDFFTLVGSRFPATDPYLRTSITIEARDTAAAYIRSCKARWMEPWSRTVAAEVVKRFPKIEIDFSYEVNRLLDGSNGELRLQPGVEYVMESKVAIIPTYDFNQWGSQKVLKYDYSATRSIEVRPLPYLQRQQCVVTYRIHFDDAQSQLLRVHLSSVPTLLQQVSAIFGVLGAGAVVASFLLDRCCTTQGERVKRETRQNYYAQRQKDMNRGIRRVILGTGKNRGFCFLFPPHP